MSTSLSYKPSNENATSNVVKEKTILSTNTSLERKTLKTLQVGPDGRLIGLEHKKKAAPQKITVSKKPIKVYLDTKKTWLEMGTQTDKTAVNDTEVQTDISRALSKSGATAATGTGSSLDLHNDSGVGAGDIDQEAYDLMVKEPIPENYWRDLAEERRWSLAEALSENEMLHQSMEEMKEENLNLSLLAGQAEYLASVLNDVLGDKNEETDDKKEDQESTEKHTETNEKKVKKDFNKEENEEEPSEKS